MTDLQVKAQANAIAERANAIKEYEAQTRARQVAEEARRNRQQELITEARNLAEYGSIAYMPTTAGFIESYEKDPLQLFKRATDAVKYGAKQTWDTLGGPLSALIKS